MSEQTTMQVAFEQAGIIKPDERLRNIAKDVLQRGGRLEDFARALEGDLEALLCLFDAEEIVARQRRYLDRVAQEIGSRPDGASASLSQGDQSRSIPSRTQPNETTEMRAGGGQQRHTNGRDGCTPASAQPDRDAAGQNQATGNGQGRRTSRLPGHAKPIDPASAARVATMLSKATVKGVLAEAIGVGRRPLAQVTWGEVEHLYRLRGNDALQAARETALLGRLRQWVPDDPTMRNMQIGADKRLPEIERDLDDAVTRWESFTEKMRQRAVGELEGLLEDASNAA